MRSAVIAGAKPLRAGAKPFCQAPAGMFRKFIDYLRDDRAFGRFFALRRDLQNAFCVFSLRQIHPAHCHEENQMAHLRGEVGEME